MKTHLIHRLLGGLVLSFAATAAGSVAAADLTVYTYQSFVTEWGPGPGLQQRFEARCGCRIEFVGADDGVALLNRLRLEGAATRADVVVGLDDSLMADARALGLVQPHRLDLEALPLAPVLAWSDADFIPFDYGFFAFIYDAERTPAPARSFAELLAGDARVIYQDPRTSTPGLGLVHWMKAVHGDAATEAWRQLAARTVTVTGGWTEAYGMFLKGESDYVLSYTTSPAYHRLMEQTERYRAAEFAEGHVAQVEVAAIGAHARNPDLARSFLAFLLEPDAQALIPVTNWMLPVRTDVALPPAFAELAQPRRIGFDPATMGAHRQAWVREWRNAVAR
ncbi:MAG: thiamine ABC transporter substrate binding subunit [Rhodocyclaceae bacterium]